MGGCYLPGGLGIPIDAEYDAIETVKEIEEQEVFLKEKFNKRPTHQLEYLLEKRKTSYEIQLEMNDGDKSYIDSKLMNGINEIEAELKR